MNPSEKLSHDNEIIALLKTTYPARTVIYYDFSHTSRSKTHEYYRVFGIATDEHKTPKIMDLSYPFGYLVDSVVYKNEHWYAKLPTGLIPGHNLVRNIAKIVHGDDEGFVPRPLGIF